MSAATHRLLPDPRLIRRGYLIAPVAAVVFVISGIFVSVASPTVLVLAGAACGLGVIAFLSALSPRAAVLLVFAASVLSGFTLPTPVGVLRLDQAFVLPALCGVVARWVSDRKPALPTAALVPTLLTVSLGLFVLANLASSILMALDLGVSLRVVMWIALSLAAYLLTVVVARRYCPVPTLVDDVIAVGAAASGAAILLYGLAILGIVFIGVQTDPVTGTLAAKGTLHESNLLGSFAAMTALLSASQLIHLRGRTTRRRAWLFASIAVCLAATYLSYTRAAWLGLAAGGLVLLLISRPPRGRSRTFWHATLALGVAAALLFVTGAGPQIIDRVVSLITDSSGTIAYRSAIFELAVRGITEHVWFGLGTNSYGQHYLDPSQDYGPAYLGGLLIATMWDVGLVGTSMLMVAFGSIALKLRHGLAPSDEQTTALAAGFAAAFVCGMIAYQATNGFWFAYNWILIGLAACIPVRVSSGESRHRSVAASATAPATGPKPQIATWHHTEVARSKMDA